MTSLLTSVDNVLHDHGDALPWAELVDKVVGLHVLANIPESYLSTEGSSVQIPTRLATAGNTSKQHSCPLKRVIDAELQKAGGMLPYKRLRKSAVAALKGGDSWLGDDACSLGLRVLCAIPSSYVNKDNDLVRLPIYEDEDLHEENAAASSLAAEAERCQVRCAICLNELGSTNNMVTTCGHKFCSSCLLRWFCGRSNARCPICRNDLLSTSQSSTTSSNVMRSPVLPPAPPQSSSSIFPRLTGVHSSPVSTQRSRLVGEHGWTGELQPEQVMPSGITYIDVPYEQKDEAKSMGARWDPDERRWYVQENAWSFSRWFRRYLDVPYEQKDEAKSMGARWDPDRMQWWISGVDDLSGFHRWL